MASAFVTDIRGGGKGPEGMVVFMISCTYTGTDVPEEIEGQSYDVPVVVATGFPLADLRSAIGTATVDQATVLGISVTIIVSNVLAVGAPGVAPSVEALTASDIVIALGGDIDLGDGYGLLTDGHRYISFSVATEAVNIGIAGLPSLAITNSTGVFNSLAVSGITDLEVSGEIGWASRSAMKSPSDGVMTLYNDALTGFGRLNWGGDTSGHPALARSGAALTARLADDSADANFRCFMLQLQGNSSAAPALARSGTTLVARLADDSADTGFRCAGLTVTTVAAGGLISANGGLTVASGQTLTVTGVTVTGLTAASVGAGTYPAGAHVFAGNVSGIPTLDFTTSITKSGVQVLAARRTGWTDQTAVAARTDLGVSPTAANIAKAFRALYDDLKAHGLIGN